MIEVITAEGERATRQTMDFDEAREILGYVELLRLDVGMLMLDEDGRAKGLPLNHIASTLAGVDVVGPAIYLTGDSIHEVLGD